MKNKTLVTTLSLLALMGVAAAAEITIPADQPICRLYSLIRLFGTLGGVLVAAYAGFQLATSHDTSERNNAKTLISGVVMGLIIIWIAPLLVKNLVGAGDLCGW
jgi:hypothetical protein